MKLATIFTSIRIGLMTMVVMEMNQNANAALRGESERRLQTPSIVRLDLINSSSDVALQTLRDGDTVVLDNLAVALPNLNVQAVTSGTGIAAVTFGLDGIANFRTEKAAPYALCGDTNSNYYSCPQLGIGKHTITVQMSGTGGVIDRKTVTFTVVQSSMVPVLPTLAPVASPVKAPTIVQAPAILPTLAPVLGPATPCPGIQHLLLINTISGMAAVTINDGDTIGLDNNGLTVSNLNIEALTCGTGIGSVKFELDSNPNVRTENTAPYSLCGNSGRNYSACTSTQLGLGTHIVKVIMYSGGGGTGTVISKKSVQFTIAVALPAPTLSSAPASIALPAPTLAPTPNPVALAPSPANGVILKGELRKWHKITLEFQNGPLTSEDANLNPFTDYRLDVTFSNGLLTYVVPGYYAANGNAAETSATSGTVWHCHFAPPQTGTWTWRATFLAGSNISMQWPLMSGTPTNFHGSNGSFVIAPTNKTGRDLRGKGLLKYVGKQHLQFSETGEYFLKAGVDSPENFLAYEDFDNTPNYGNRRKSWAPHAGDYQPGDPTWAGGKGSEMIGAINYLARKGLNSLSFLTMNINGDDKNVFMYTSDSAVNRTRIDVSKCAQWEIVFEHADKMGMYLHFKTQETENDQLLDGGELGNERKLYYRELIARFGHHLALNWNLGEENTNTPQQRKNYADYIRAIDPYDHPIVVHTYIGDKKNVYPDLLGHPTFDGASLQCNPTEIFKDTLEWVQRSANAGRKWIVSNDEQGNGETGVVPDSVDPSHDAIRTQVLWGNIMAGGAGVEYYFGYNYANSDLTCQDFRSRDAMYDQSRHALSFFSEYAIPFWDMSNRNSIVSNSNWCLADTAGKNILIFLIAGGAATVNVTSFGGSKTWTVGWFDPRMGGTLQNGSVTQLSGGTVQPLGSAPYSSNRDWAVLLRCASGCPP